MHTPQILGRTSVCGGGTTADADTGGWNKAAGGATGAKRVIVDVFDTEVGAGECRGGTPGGKPVCCCIAGGKWLAEPPCMPSVEPPARPRGACEGAPSVPGVFPQASGTQVRAQAPSPTRAVKRGRPLSGLMPSMETSNSLGSAAPRCAAAAAAAAASRACSLASSGCGSGNPC